MRVRKRYAVMLAIAAMICGVVIFQAVTATPPEPYVELVRAPTEVPRIRMECVRGQSVVVHYDGHGREISRIEDGYFCDPQDQARQP